ncbi:MAG: SAM-dependent methyltransferase [Rhodobacteraceae bacterium]|nr:SAM-dependent methyltransferase [Paracoccaceae bacterium]
MDRFPSCSQQEALMAQTTPSSSNFSLDQFFTRPDTAETCIAMLAARLPDLSPDLYVEPAAGDGAFLDRLPQPRFGLDIVPSGPGMETGDFLEWVPDDRHQTIAVVGNPPFGRNAAKAIAFFNHAARFAKVIAMILPASLMKGSMQDRLDPNFHLIDELPLPAEPFRVGETLRPVNTVFQIWRREPSLRAKSVRKTRHADFSFVNTASDADFVLRRVGARAGAILPRPENGRDTPGYSPSSNYFVKAVDLEPKVLEARFGELDFGDVRQRVAANPSVSKTDIVTLYEAQLDLERIAKGVPADRVGALRN